MTEIRAYIQYHLLEPLKNYPTIIGDTMIEIITQRLEELYELTLRFPEIVTPDRNRLDILKSIADQFSYTLREDADLQEQLDILENILYVYRRRGSIDTIENMWLYYGGKLPRDIKVIIPSHNLFKYSVSEFSGSDKFVKGDASYVLLDTSAPESIDNGSLVVEEGTNRYRVTSGVPKGSNRVFLYTVDGLSEGSILDIAGVYKGVVSEVYDPPKEGLNRVGVYEIRLTNNYYPITDLREFFIKELSTAGTYFYFTNALHMDLSELAGDSTHYKYLVEGEQLVNLQLTVLRSHQGFNWSGLNVMSRRSEDSAWSGRREIFLELTNMIDLSRTAINTYRDYLGEGFSMTTMKDVGGTEYFESDSGDLVGSITSARYREWNIRRETVVTISSPVYCTPTYIGVSMTRNLYNRQDELLESDYPGYFILGESLLGKEVL